MSSSSLIRAKLANRLLRNMRRDTLPDRFNFIADGKLSAAAPGGWCVSTRLNRDTPMNRYTWFLCATSAARQIYSSYPSVRLYNSMSERLSLCHISRRVRWLQNCRLCSSYTSLRNIDKASRRTSSQIERRYPSEEKRFFHIIRS